MKLWVTLAHSGTSGLKQQIAGNIALARFLEDAVEADPDFELCSKGPLSIVCFRYRPRALEGSEEALDALNKSIMEQTQADGITFLTNTTLSGRFVLRACILHYATTRRDIESMLDAVRDVARRVMGSSGK